MRDFLPAEKARRERILGVIRGVYRAHGFDEIETPVAEDSERNCVVVKKSVRGRPGGPTDLKSNS